MDGFLSDFGSPTGEHFQLHARPRVARSFSVRTMNTLAHELNKCTSQLKQRMAELRDELAAVQRESVSAARSSARFDPVWGRDLIP